MRIKRIKICIYLLIVFGLQAHPSVCCSVGLVVFSRHFPDSFARWLRLDLASERPWQEPRSRKESKKGLPCGFSSFPQCDGCQGWRHHQPQLLSTLPAPVRLYCLRSADTLGCEPLGGPSTGCPRPLRGLSTSHGVPPTFMVTALSKDPNIVCGRSLLGAPRFW